MDVGQTAFSALTLAPSAQLNAQTEASAEPLACFVLLEGGQWQRMLGERGSLPKREIFGTDRAGFVEDIFLEGGPGIVKIFRHKFSLNAGERISVSVRDTFTVGTLRQKFTPHIPSSTSSTSGTSFLGDTSDPLGVVMLEASGLRSPFGKGGDLLLNWRVHVLRGADGSGVRGAKLLTDRIRSLLSLNVDTEAIHSVDMWNTIPNAAGAEALNASTVLESTAQSILSAPISPAPTASEMWVASRVGSTSEGCRYATPRNSLLSRF